MEKKQKNKKSPRRGAIGTAATTASPARWRLVVVLVLLLLMVLCRRQRPALQGAAAAAAATAAPAVVAWTIQQIRIPRPRQRQRQRQRAQRSRATTAPLLASSAGRMQGDHPGRIGRDDGRSAAAEPEEREDATRVPLYCARQQRHLLPGRADACGGWRPPPLPCPPLLAIVTDPKSCDTHLRLDAALNSLKGAVSTQKVDLVIVRLEPPVRCRTRLPCDDDADVDRNHDDRDAYRRRVGRLLRTLGKWSGKKVDDEEEDHFRGEGGWTSNRPKPFLVVVSSGLLLAEPPLLDLDDENDAALMGSVADGVHVKESHREQLPSILERIFTTGGGAGRGAAAVGMSCHSVPSALEAHTKYRPDYLLVGTCYPTPSHPEKTQSDVEGPDLPGQIRLELERIAPSPTDTDLGRMGGDAVVDGSSPKSEFRRRPFVLGVGGINADNCGRVVEGGADGVAVIRSVLAAPKPADAVQQIVDGMILKARARAGDDDDASPSDK